MQTFVCILQNLTELLLLAVFLLFFFKGKWQHCTTPQQKLIIKVFDLDQIPHSSVRCIIKLCDSLQPDTTPIISAL